MTTNKESDLLFLRDNDPALTRLDLTAARLQNWPEWRKLDLIAALPENHCITTVHMSGKNMDDDVLTEDQVRALMEAISQMPSVTDLFCFGGDSEYLTLDLVASALPPKLTVLMLWQFDLYEPPQNLAAAICNHQALQRLSIHLPASRCAYSCLDVIAMAVRRLHVVQIRGKAGRRIDPVISPEAFGVLLSNESRLQTLYLEGCGLLDDHMDVLLEDGVGPAELGALHLADNFFSDDALYTLGRWLSRGTLPKGNFHETTAHAITNPQPTPSVRVVDLSRVNITREAGEFLSTRMNTKIQHLELEGQLYHDEFVVRPGHSDSAWMRLIEHQLRWNRAVLAHPRYEVDRSDFCSALSHVSDSVPALYEFVRFAGRAHLDHLTIPVKDGDASVMITDWADVVLPAIELSDSDSDHDEP